MRIDCVDRIGCARDRVAAPELQGGTPRQQHVARPQQPREPRARDDRIGIVDELRVAIFQIVAHHALGPEHQPRCAAGMARQRRQPAQHLRALDVAALVLADIRLDDADARGAGQRRDGGLPVTERLRDQQHRDDRDRARPPPASQRDRRARQHDGQPRQRIGPDQRGDRRDGLHRHPQHAQRIPGIAGEHRRAQPFGRDPRGAERQHERPARWRHPVAAPAGARQPPRDPGREHRIDRQI